jgi:hypothetical protein
VFRRDRRGAFALVASALAITATGYAPAGFDAVRAVGHAGNGNSRASVWDPVSTALHPTTTMMMIAVLAFATFAVWRVRGVARPADAAVGGMAAFLIGGVYVLPWYAAWALPVAALERRSRLALLVGVHAAFLVAVYQYELPAHPRLTGAAAVVRSIAIQTGAWCALGMLVAFLLRTRTERTEHADPNAQSGTAEATHLLAP